MFVCNVQQYYIVGLVTLTGNIYMYFECNTTQFDCEYMWHPKYDAHSPAAIMNIYCAIRNAKKLIDFSTCE